MPDIRSAYLYSRAGEFILASNVQTEGATMTGDTVSVLKDSTSNDKLGSALLEVLSRFRSGAPAPTKAEMSLSRPNPVLRAARVKSWTSFAKGSLTCSVLQDDSRVTFIPTRARTSRASWSHLAESAVVVSLPAAPEEIGIAAREALRRCE